jgi:hypothetical protein
MRKSYNKKKNILIGELQLTLKIKLQTYENSNYCQRKPD